MTRILITPEPRSPTYDPADGDGFAHREDEDALFADLGADEAFGRFDADLEMTAESRGVDRPAVLLPDHLKALGKPRVSGFDRDGIDRTVVINRHSLWPAKRRVRLCVHIDKPFAVKRNANHL